MRWTALVLAGKRPGRDKFAARFGTDLKALITVAGEPMVRRPVAALLASKMIAEVHVLAQEPERIAEVLPKDRRIQVVKSRGTIAETLLALCEDAGTEWPLLVTTADHALLDEEMVKEFCGRAARSDIAIGVVKRRRLLRRLPKTRRTWVHFRDGGYTGANMFILRTGKVAPAIELWRAVEQDRKKALTLLWSLGPTLFIGAVLRLRSIDGTFHKISRRLGMSIRAIELSNPLAAVDVDKMSDHRLVESILEGRT